MRLSPNRVAGKTRPCRAPSRLKQPLSAARIFDSYFSGLYPPGTDLANLRQVDANPGKNRAILKATRETAELFAKLAPEALDEPNLNLDFSDASVHRLAVALTLASREKLLVREGGKPPLLVHFVVHGTIYLGECVVQNHEGEWLLRNPLWESRVKLTSRAGTAELAPFSWWLRSFSDDEIGKGTLIDRYRTNVEVPTFDPSTLAVIAPPDRRLPRLEKVRYDLLYKYIKAHLPELKFLGDDFPSPERIAELRLESLSFQLVGEGRVLLMHGAGRSGVFLFFLGKEGFLKQHYYEAGGGESPDYKLEVVGDIVRVSLKRGKGEDVHESLFWGG